MTLMKAVIALTLGAVVFLAGFLSGRHSEWRRGEQPPPASVTTKTAASGKSIRHSAANLEKKSVEAGIAGTPEIRPVEIDFDALRRDGIQIRKELENYRWSSDPGSLMAAIEAFAPRIDPIPTPRKDDLWDDIARHYAATVTDGRSLEDGLSAIMQVATAKGLEASGLKSRLMQTIGSQAATLGLSLAVSQTGIPPQEGNGLENRLRHELSGTISGRRLAAGQADMLKGLSEIMDKRERQAAEVVVVRELMARNESAAAWLLSEESQCPRESDIFTSVFGTGTLENGEAISQMVRDAPPSPRRDWAIYEIVDKIAAVDFKAALAWVGQIQDQKVRAEALDTLKAPNSYATFRDAEEAERVHRLMLEGQKK